MVKAYLEIDNLFVKPIEFQMLEQHEESSEFSFDSPLGKRIGSTSSTEEIEDDFFTHLRCITRNYSSLPYIASQMKKDKVLRAASYIKE